VIIFIFMSLVCASSFLLINLYSNKYSNEIMKYSKIFCKIIIKNILLILRFFCAIFFGLWLAIFVCTWMTSLSYHSSFFFVVVFPNLVAHFGGKDFKRWRVEKWRPAKVKKISFYLRVYIYR